MQHGCRAELDFIIQRQHQQLVARAAKQRNRIGLIPDRELNLKPEPAFCKTGS